MLRKLCLLLAALLPAVSPLTAQITVSFPAGVSSKPLDGRVLLLLSTDPAKEPRMQIDDSPRSQIVFGTTVEGLAPDQALTITNEAAGYPIRSLNDVLPGDYYVQAVWDRNLGGRAIAESPGNMYSPPMKVRLTKDTGERFNLICDQVVAARPFVPAPFVKELKVASELLSRSQGRSTVRRSMTSADRHSARCGRRSVCEARG